MILFDALERTDSWTAALTKKRIERALKNFPLSFSAGWDFARLTWHIKGAAGIGRIQPPQSNSDARKELDQWASKARTLADGIKGIGDTATFEVLWELAPKNEEGSTLDSQHGRLQKPSGRTAFSVRRFARTRGFTDQLAPPATASMAGKTKSGTARWFCARTDADLSRCLWHRSKG